MLAGRIRMMASGSAHIIVGAADMLLHSCRYGSSIVGRTLPRQCRNMSFAKHDAGFTLVEVIVALAMLSIGLTVLLGQLSHTFQQTANTERVAEADSLARSLMAEVAADLPIKLQGQDGQFPDGYRWHLKMYPYGDAREREEWPVGIYMISAEVEWEEGDRHRSYALTTLRLGPKQVRQ